MCVVTRWRAHVLRDRPADSHGEGGPFQVGGPVADALYMFVRVGSVCAGQAGASKKWHYSCAIKPHTHGKGQHKLGISAPISAPPYDASVLSPSAYPTKWDCSVGVEAGGHTKHDGLRHVALWRWCGGCGRHETRWPTPRGIVEMLLYCPPACIPLSGIVSVRDLVTAKPVQSLFAISASERSLHVLVLHTCACAPVFHCRFGLSAAASSAAARRRGVTLSGMEDLDRTAPGPCAGCAATRTWRSRWRRDAAAAAPCAACPPVASRPGSRRGGSTASGGRSAGPSRSCATRAGRPTAASTSQRGAGSSCGRTPRSAGIRPGARASTGVAATFIAVLWLVGSTTADSGSLPRSGRGGPGPRRRWCSAASPSTFSAEAAAVAVSAPWPSQAPRFRLLGALFLDAGREPPMQVGVVLLLVHLWSNWLLALAVPLLQGPGELIIHVRPAFRVEWYPFMA